MRGSPMVHELAVAASEDLAALLAEEQTGAMGQIIALSQNAYNRGLEASLAEGVLRTRRTPIGSDSNSGLGGAARRFVSR